MRFPRWHSLLLAASLMANGAFLICRTAAVKTERDEDGGVSKRQSLSRHENDREDRRDWERTRKGSEAALRERLMVSVEIASQVIEAALLDDSDKVTDTMAAYLSLTGEERAKLDESLAGYLKKIAAYQVEAAWQEFDSDGKEWIVIPAEGSSAKDARSQLAKDMSSLLGKKRGDACFQLIRRYGQYQSRQFEQRFHLYMEDGQEHSISVDLYNGKEVGHGLETGNLDVRRKYQHVLDRFGK